MASYAPYGSGSSYTSFSTLAPETVPAAEKVRRHPKYYLNGGDTHFLVSFSFRCPRMCVCARVCRDDVAVVFDRIVHCTVASARDPQRVRVRQLLIKLAFFATCFWQVENYIFRVHRYFFERESAVFREKLNIPPAPGQNPRGSSDSNPIPLDDVREEDFSRFLWVFYNPKYSIYDANVDEWSSILKLSYDWKFAEVKRLSSRYLEQFDIDPIQKIELYQMYEIDKRLLIPSYMALINRQEPLSIIEGRRLSLETALMIATARECARGKPLESGKHSPTVASVNRESMVEIIKDVFGLRDLTPRSPNLEPIYEGVGPSAFAATPMSPSKIVTSPPRDSKDEAKSPSRKSRKHLPPTGDELVPQLRVCVIRCEGGQEGCRR
ncbi:hypothetical protein BDY19DRAFT_301400 [Irpex rosettiformis]|uniref:Uncharacterized protein n=1 Tax=Irpex rosettiformis TaxID=378272 RepID=A0ACB8TZ09_9APHY|nr:hypothetical protein BDY19DRAFT_301400 [Irpex rosettiformis]